MIPPVQGRSDTVGSDKPQEPIQPPPPYVTKLRDLKARLSALLEDFDISPDSLDVQANEIHQGIVMEAYKLMRTEVAQACGLHWVERDRQRFGDTYHAAANKWPTYRQALDELDWARKNSTSQVDEMTRLEGPRSGYIDALLSFYKEFSGTLDYFFPPPPR